MDGGGNVAPFKKCSQHRRRLPLLQHSTFSARNEGGWCGVVPEDDNHLLLSPPFRTVFTTHAEVEMPESVGGKRGNGKAL